MKHRIALAIFLFCFVLTFFLAPHIGVSWDEPDNIWAGGVYINFFRNGFNPTILLDRNASYFQEKIYTQEPSLYRYPPFPLYIGNFAVLLGENLFGSFSSQQIIVAYHIASGFFWSIFAVGVYYFADMFGFPLFICVLTALIAAFHPTLLGYGLSNIKDSGQVSLFTISLLLLIQSTLKKKRSFFILGTLIWGIAMATKINAIYVPVLWGVWRIVTERKIFSLIRILRDEIILVLFGGVTMIVLWPYLWFDPIVRLREVFTYFTTVGTGYKVFWNGDVYMTGIGNPLPWYPILHIIIGTPIPVLLLSLFGFITLMFLLLRRKKTLWIWVSLLGFWIIIPLARTFTARAAFYDGMRHFLEVLPPILLLSTWGLITLWKFVSRLLHNSDFGGAILSLGLITYLFFLNWHFFPYNSGYVNGFVRNPNGMVERDYGGLSVADAVGLAHTYDPSPSTFFVPIAGHLSWYYLQPGDSYVYSIYDADILILINKSTHITKNVFDAQVSSMFDLKGKIFRGNDDFAWIYVKRK